MKLLKDFLFTTPYKFFYENKRELCKAIGGCGGGSGGGGVTTFNGRAGDVTLTNGDVTTALGFTPPSSGSNFIIAGTDASGNIIDATNAVIQRTLTGYVVGANTAIVAADTILGAFQKIQGQLNGKINNQTTVQTASSFNIDTRAIVTQASLTAGTGSVGSNQVSPLTVLGGTGQSTSFAGGSAQGGNAGLINIQGGNGGSLSGTPTFGIGGKGGFVYLTAGNGGSSLGAGTTSGDGGDIEVSAGSSGINSVSSSAGRAGFASLKGGNTLGSNNALGGHVYIVSGQGSSSVLHGSIFLGLSPSDVMRGVTFIGCQQGEIAVAATTDKLYVRGRARFVDTPVQGIAAVASNDFPILSQVLAKADYKGGQSPFTADGTTTQFDVTHNLGAIPAYFTLTTTAPISSNHLNRTLSFPNTNTMRITFANAPLVGEDANYVWIVYR